MTDTEILDSIRNRLRLYSGKDGAPALVISPARAERWANWIDQERGCRRDTGMPEIPYKKGGPYPSLQEQRPHYDADITNASCSEPPQWFIDVMTKSLECTEQRDPHYVCKPRTS